jgi:2-dehydro-3-deoxy-D-gluconate 5-dehydrogenase
MNMFDLTGASAIVTGASTGLGAAMSLALSAAGAEVLLVDRREQNETVGHLRSIGKTAHTFQADLSDPKAPQQIVDAALKEFGKVDILVNNAGIIRRTPALEFSEQDWDEVMDINARAVFFLSQAAGRDMVKRKRGKIVNVASLLSFQGGVTVPSYSASKGAVAQITKALANEWASMGINVNAIAPGYMVTNNTEQLRANETRYRQITERIPAGRWGEPEDLGGVVVFLASKASDYVNGHVLLVDGGWMAR